MTNTEVKPIEDFYGEDLPNKITFAAEVEMWKQKCAQLLPNDQLEKMRLVGALNVVDKEFFPNVHEVLKLIDFTSWVCALWTFIFKYATPKGLE